MNAIVKPAEVRFAPMQLHELDAVLAIEQRVYPHPWNHTNFSDAMGPSYEAQLLMADDTLLGYFVALKGVDEVHLLNITVAPEFQRQGWALTMLDALRLWSTGQSAQWLWLEVRVSNTRALQVYQRYGFRHVGRRKDYYPNGVGGINAREDALVMSLKL